MAHFRVQILLLILASIVAMGTGCKEESRVKPGLEVLVEKRLHLLKGKAVGIITNQSGITSDGRHIVDALSALPEVKIVALFSPEHGIRGEAAAGEFVGTYIDSITGLPVYSLYGKTKKPTLGMLKGIEVLLFDIQDIGTRFYTYVSTMTLAMEAASEAGITFVVLDRPDPIAGVYIDGPVLEPPFASFIGLHPVPICYGMTIGELALMINGEGYLSAHRKLDLKVIEMENWRRSTWFDGTGLPWVRPSPNIFSPQTALLFPATGIMEGTNVSEGRGTYKTFEYIGAPWINGEELAQEMRSRNLPGVSFQPATFTPVDIPGIATNPKYEGQICRGIFIGVTDRQIFQPVRLGIHLLSALKKLYPRQFTWRRDLYIDKLMGTDKIRRTIDQDIEAEAVIKSWRQGLDQFKKIRQKYLLYH